MLAGYLQFDPAFCNADANINKIADLTSGKDFDLLVMPELSNSGYLFISKDEVSKSSETIPGGKFCSYLKELSKNKKAYIVSGINEKSGDKYYNSSILVCPDGNIITYRKIHLFYEERMWFMQGDKPFFVSKLNIKGKTVKTGMMICYDWIYPESARSLALQGAQIICHPSNLVMPYCQQAMYARAVENRIFTITANRTGTEKNGSKELYFTGQSVIIDPKGNYLARGSENGEECAIVEINPEEADNKKMNDINSIFDDRRLDMYSV
jgi:predicted amidohydrolase